MAWETFPRFAGEHAFKFHYPSRMPTSILANGKLRLLLCLQIESNCSFHYEFFGVVTEFLGQPFTY